VGFARLLEACPDALINNLAAVGSVLNRV